MKLTIKILKLFAILILAVSIILISASFLLRDKVADIILVSLNKNISTKLDIGSFKLSFLKKFPKASLELKNVLVHSSTGFNSKSFTGINTDTLLSARSVSVEFRITDILKGIYNIERIGAKDGRLNLYSDTSGLVNYDITSKKGNSDGGDFTIDLERVNLSNIQTSYTNLSTKLKVEGLIKNAKLKSRISESNIDLTALADMQISVFQLYNSTIRNRVIANLDLILQSNKSGIRFKKGALHIDNFDFELDGLISADNILDLNIRGNNIDISKIRKYFPEKFNSLISDYDPAGILIVKSKIKGPLSRTSNPHIEISCLLNKGRITYSKSDLTVDNLSFSGVYSNGLKNRRETSTVSVHDIKARLGTAEYTGSLVITDFVYPKTELLLKGKVFPEELKKYFNIKNISAASGSFDIDLKLITNFWPKEKITLTDIIDIKPEANIDFNSLTIGFNHDSILFQNLNGKMFFSNTVIAKNLGFTFKKQRIKIDGEFENLPEWLSGRAVNLTAKADASFSRLIPDIFFKDSPVSYHMSRRKTAFSLPADIFLDLNFKVDSLDYKTFSSTGISGTLNYKPGLLTFKSLNLNSLNGTISGNGFLVQNNIKSWIARGNFKIADVDVNKAFVTFHNFGQDFLKAENIAGTLSGTLSVLIPMDSLLTPQIKVITAEGKYQLLNGALLNFDPVKQLSKFIELSELENIHFEKMENDFFIRNNILFIPQMDVRSSAVDLSVNGKHSFDNDYEYHVKMLLSEILSKKRKKSKSNISEFGIVEEDGLGRTKLLLKIINKGNDFKVSYDLKAAGNEVKNNIKAEKQSLKNILNQEYGWYKSDSVPKQQPAEKKKRFKISFDETDSTKTISKPPEVKKRNSPKKVFRIED